MKTITFYSYKGGTGRSLALANAARYLARLEFKVVALDFDLEAPGLHYKFATNGKPLNLSVGVVDYLHSFIVEAKTPRSLREYTVDVIVPGSDKPFIQLIPAGCGPSSEYWTKLSRIDWHALFYAKGAKGVQIFLDLKNRIADELQPDFLLIDSRTGITEMGGVATTLLADKVVSLVLPSRENLEGARAVLRSIRRSRREGGSAELEMLVALSRIPDMKDSEGEQDWIERIRATLNEEADDLRDTLACSEVLVLHSEAALEMRESLRIGSGVSPEDSILLRDYLRLFAKVVPPELIEPKVKKLIQQAKEKIWEDPEAALKEVEELAESFGHPENYRALLHFYEVRNVGGPPALRRAQRLWELTRDSNEPILWHILLRTFDLRRRILREDEWVPDLDFVEAVWREAGKKNPEFGVKVAEALRQDNRPSRAADVLLEVLKLSEPTAEIVALCIEDLDMSDREAEASELIQDLKLRLLTEPAFVAAWARHALRESGVDGVAEIVQSPARDALGAILPATAAQVLLRAGLVEDASVMAEKVLSDLRSRGPQTRQNLNATAELFSALGKWEEFEDAMEDTVPQSALRDLRLRMGHPLRR